MSSSLGGGMGMRGPAGSSVGNQMDGNKGKGLKGYDVNQLQNYTPEQMQLFQSLFSQVGPDSYLSRLAGGDQDVFSQLEAPAMRQFQELQGQNASRFSGFGMGARRGSGFQNYQNQSTEDFAAKLASNRMALQRQALGDLMGFSNTLLNQRPYDTFLTEKQKPWWQDLLLGFNERGREATNAAVKVGGAYLGA